MPLTKLRSACQIRGSGRVVVRPYVSNGVITLEKQRVDFWIECL